MGDNLGFLFNPRSIAVVGASNAPGKLSSIIMESVKNAGFSGKIFPVNPKYEELNGLRCYPNLRSIGETIDLAVVALPAQKAVEAIKSAGGALRAAIVISGGFSEIDEAGKLLEQELKEAGKKQNIRIIGPNCMGIYDAISNVDTFFISRERVKRPKKGSIAILSQSGSFALTAMDELASYGIGVTRVVSYGNKIDVDEADCLEYISTDDSTDTVILYIEGIENGRRFVESALRCRGKKTLMALKAGRLASGQDAVRSHTGAMAGSYEVYKAAFKKAGIIELESYEALMDAARASGDFKNARGNRVMLITDGGGMGVSMADECAERGLSVEPLSEKTKNSIKAKLPRYLTISNPLDLTGSATDEWYGETLAKTMEGDDFDMAIVTVLWGPPNLTDNLAGLLAGVKKRCSKPVIICSPGGNFTESKRIVFERKGLRVYTTPESAVRAASVIAKKALVKL